MLVYTSITKNYLPKARVLAKSLKKFHPEWDFYLVISDSLPAHFNLDDEPFDGLLTLQDLGINNYSSWSFGHSLVELCTAVKGPAAKIFAAMPYVDKIMYLDPDIKVFNSLSDLDRLLDEADILLTPHLLIPESENNAILDNEISALKHGVFNLGFFAAKTSGQGLNFINWWSDRLSEFCLNDIPNGLFTDQRWCDLAPAFFSNLKIIFDPGYNVATWNIAHRPLSRALNSDIFAGKSPLRFYHFTSFDNGNGAGMLDKYAGNQMVAKQIWSDYAQDLLENGHFSNAQSDWAFEKFDGGEKIPNELRRLYKSRVDLQNAFPDPYSISKPSLYEWWLAEKSQPPVSAHKRYKNYLSRIFRKT